MCIRDRFTPFHDIGNSETIFDRFDYQPNGQNAFHLNLFAARNWIQIPNTYDTLDVYKRQVFKVNVGN